MSVVLFLLDDMCLAGVSSGFLRCSIIISWTLSSRPVGGASIYIVSGVIGSDAALLGESRDLSSMSVSE